MAGKFEFRKFADIDLGDPFFDSLKEDYPADGKNIGFEKWFAEKAAAGNTALVFGDDEGLGAFVSLKEENESIELRNRVLPALPRMKIRTLRVAERYRGQRLGEGALGLALWKWQTTKTQEIYVTVYPKHELLISQLEKFGLCLAGYNPNGECVYVKSRDAIDYSDPYKAFPFINPSFRKAGYLIVNDEYHDTLFPYSEVSGMLQESVGAAVANGLCKIYVGRQYTRPHYGIGEPILIYRKHTKQDGQKARYKSCVTSFCIVTDVIMVKTNYRCHMSFGELKARIRNKSVFDEDEIRTRYDRDRNVVVIEMLYYGYFGSGNNVNMDWLDKNGHWTGEYPANIQLSPEQFKAILTEGNVDVSNVIIH